MSMNKITDAFILFLLLGSLSDNKKMNIVEEKRELPVAEFLKADTVPVHQQENRFVPEKKAVTVIPDTTINNKLFLENYKSLSNFYSDEKPLILVEGLRENPVIIFASKSLKEYLLAYRYEGNIENAYSCFEIGYFEEDRKVKLEKAIRVKESKFQTESGLCLGLSLKDVIRIKGEGYEQQKSGDYIVLNYKVEDFENSSFLQQYNMPGYFIKIKLKNNIVTNITFGFDYP